MHVSNKLSDLEKKESYNKEKILISSSNANTTIFYEYISISKMNLKKTRVIVYYSCDSCDS